jgi:ATP-dependent Zn protease
MRKFLFLLLVMASQACTTNYILMGPSAVVPKPADDEPMIQSVHEQYKTAVHEAAHALYGAAVYGPSYIKTISVMQLCCMDGLSDNLGETEYVDRVTAHDASDLREQMAFAFAGRAGDVVILGVPNAGAGSDITEANKVAWAMANGNALVGQGKLGFLVSPTFSEATPEQKRLMTCELENANARAEAFVRKNRQAILLLADVVMHQPVEGYAHVFKGIGLRILLKRIVPKITEAPSEPICIVAP